MFIQTAVNFTQNSHISQLSFHFFIGIFTWLPLVIGICLGIVSHFPIYMSLGLLLYMIERAIGWRRLCRILYSAFLLIIKVFGVSSFSCGACLGIWGILVSFNVHVIFILLSSCFSFCLKALLSREERFAAISNLFWAWYILYTCCSLSILGWMTSSTWSLYAKSLFALTIRLQVFSVFSRDRLPALLEGEDFFGGNSHLQGHQGSHMLFKPSSS